MTCSSAAASSAASASRETPSATSPARAALPRSTALREISRSFIALLLAYSLHDTAYIEPVGRLIRSARVADDEDGSAEAQVFSHLPSMARPTLVESTL